MKIVKTAERFKKDGDKYIFRRLELIIENGDGSLYFAKSLCRNPSAPDLYDKTFLQSKDRGPKTDPSWAVASQSNMLYTKNPDLWAYLKPNLDQQILREIEICEILKLHPHPNIAGYFGCVSENGKVSGICFKRYKTTLLEMANPQFLSKSAFLASGRPYVTEVAKSSLDGILKGIHHLHGLGIIHNDINPANIMFDDNGAPVIIDYTRRVMGNF